MTDKELEDKLRSISNDVSLVLIFCILILMGGCAGCFN
jgi:hypothetical protein